MQILIVVTLALLNFHQFYNSVEGNTSDDEFDWRSLINWSASSPEKEIGLDLHNHEPVIHFTPSLVSQDVSRDLLKQRRKAADKKYYEITIKQNKEKYEKYLQKRRELNIKRKLKKKENFQSLTENEKIIEIQKKKMYNRLQYLKDKQKRGSKTRARVLLNKIYQNQATEEDVKKLGKQRDQWLKRYHRSYEKKQQQKMKSLR